MNWDQVQGKWTRVKEAMRERWGCLTDDDLEKIKGNREQLVRRIQERYGLIKEAARRQVEQFLKAYPPESEGKRGAAGQP